MTREPIAHCSCKSHKCYLNPSGFTELPRSTQQQHRDDDLIYLLHRLTLDNVQPSSTTQPTTTVSTSIVSSQRAAESLSAADDSALILATRFKSILDEYQSRSRSIRILAEKMEESASSRNSKEAIDLQDHISWIISTISHLKMLKISDGSVHYQQRNALVQILHGTLKDLQQWEESRYDKLNKVRHDSQHKKLGQDVTKYDNGRFFGQSLSSAHPLIVLSTLVSAVLNVLNDLPERPSNFLIRMHRSLLQLAFDTCNGDRDFQTERSYLLKHLPNDIRTVRSRFNLEPPIRIFATCPTCSALFEPVFDSSNNVNVYHTLRCDRINIDGSKCGASLLKWQARGKHTIRVPIRPYGYYSLHDFVGELLSRPNFEDLLERRCSETQPDILTDIFDGDAIRDFKARDGSFCFRNNSGRSSKDGKGADLYLAWAFSVDWFNPFHNKAAGKAVSVGLISMVCLNLPLELRNETRNMYVAGIIPGPNEPSLDQINNFMEPVIADFLYSWEKGIQYSKTYKYRDGRTVVSVLIPLVADMPASRKVSGTAGHGARCFCSLCLRKNFEINNISASFTKRGREEHLRLAAEWRNAQTNKEREDLVKENGIRYSVVFELPYWETRYIVVDTMHNLFLGLTRHHFQKIIGIAYEKSNKAMKRPDGRIADDQGFKITPKKIGKILGLLQDPQGPEPSKLRRFTIRELCEFHICQQVPLYPPDGAWRKDDLVLSLLNSNLVASPTITGTNQTQMNTLDLDALPIALLDDVSYIQFNVEAPRINARGSNGQRNTRASSNKRYIGQREIAAIQAAIRMTCRPSWQQSPPKKFGTTEQGKLKADQWRTLLEFDLPVTLVEVWVDSDTSVDVETNNHRLALINLTMDLAIAVSWGTSHHTSIFHAAKYLQYIQSYLQGLQKLSSKPKLVPNHHSALHVGEQLLSFGPANGWWAFPYERLIGTLQSNGTNYSIGEMELTMLKSHLTAARLQRLVHESENVNISADDISEIKKCFPLHSPGSYGSYTSESLFAKDGEDDSKAEVIEQLDEDIYNALYSFVRKSGLEHIPNRATKVLKSYVVDGFRYTSLESERDSIVFIGSDVDKLPGFIRKIFTTADGLVIFAIHPFLKLDCGISDPFAQWPEFRASLWSQRYDEQVRLINPRATYVCHAVRRPWSNQGTYVFKPLDRSGRFV